MKKLFTLLLLLVIRAGYSQMPVYYPSNYMRVVQPNERQKLDTLTNPYTGGLNSPTFFKIELNGDQLPDLFVFDRDDGENQFLNFTAVHKNSVQYIFTPKYESTFPKGLRHWAQLADYDGDGLPDLFSNSPTDNTGLIAYKNTSYVNKADNKYILQFQKFKDTLLYNDDLGRRRGIELPFATNPYFADVDQDGFLDILSFDQSLNSMYYYHNQAKYKDSLNFYFTDQCWGKFIEAGPHNYDSFNCKNYLTYDPTVHKRSSAHAASAICVFDVDADGDMDMLIGDGGNDSLTILLNGKSKNKNHRDSIINTPTKPKKNHFPNPGIPAVIHSMPMASYLDVDNDGVNDLVIAAGQFSSTDTFLTKAHGSIWYYKNEESITDPPGFVLMDTSFLQNTMVDWGIRSAPCFIDVDKDGRKDLIIAVKNGGAKHGFSHMILYLNKPAAKPGGKPFFLFQTDDYLGFSALKKEIWYPVPTGYLNGNDKKTDLIIGNDSGRAMYFKDRSIGTDPANFKLSQSSLTYLSKGNQVPIDEGANSAIAAYDINGDGKTDLLIGSNNGTISYYRCLGYGAAPDFVPYFQLVTHNFGGVNVVHQAAPCISDLNMNHKPDLLVGNVYGELLYYPDFDTTGTLKASPESLVYDYGTSQRSTGKLFSTYTIPAVANLDNDSIPDIMLGCNRGGLIFLGSANNGFETIHSGISEEKASISRFNGMKLYPNPAKEQVVLEYNNSSTQTNAVLYVTDMLGKRHIAHPFIMNNGMGQEPVATGELPAGMYIVTVMAQDEIITSSKIIIR